MLPAPSRYVAAYLAAMFLLLCTAPLFAEDDRIGAAFLPLSIHPGNQRHMAKYYDHKLDQNAILIYTPGATLWYDRARGGDTFTHIRFLGTFMSDCADMPAGFAAVCGVLPFWESGRFSASGILGAGVFARKSWKYSKVGHTNSVLFNAGKVQWIAGPYPELELTYRLPDCRAQFVMDVFTALYVSTLSFGLSIPLGG
jgi:hypothetical protein